MIKIEIPALPRVQRGVANGPRVLQSEVTTALTAGGLLVESTARSLAPRDTGRLQGSITSRVSGMQAEIGPSVAYGLYVERGTRPHFPPPAALGGWARRHGVSPFALARGIARRGTKAQPFMRPALEQNVGKIVDLFGKLGAKVVASMSS